MDPTKKIKTDKKEYYNLDDLISFRRDMHQYPEIGFKEFQTQKKIKDFLVQKCQVPEQCFKVCAQTGWIIDIYGRGQPSGKKMLIGMRADIDALTMTEENPHLEYESKNVGVAHQCGHDGHTTSMLGFISLYMEKIDNIPSDKGVRILFQPSEEGPLSGAKAMIEENCLEGVDEIYGYHNWATHDVGYLLVKPGAFMASFSHIALTFIGKGGHGAKPQHCIDPIQMSVDFHMKFRQMQKEKFEGRNFVSTLPIFRGGEADNVIPTTCYIEGTLRSLEDDLPDQFEIELKSIIEEVKQMYPGSDYKLDFEKCVYDQTNNTEKEAKIVEQLGKEFFGEDKVGTFDLVPVMGSEDFGFFTQKVPGVYFFLGQKKKGQDVVMNHDAKYNFNDDLIEPSSKFFLKIIENRFELNF